MPSTSRIVNSQGHAHQGGAGKEGKSSDESQRSASGKLPLQTHCYPDWPGRFEGNALDRGLDLPPLLVSQFHLQPIRIENLIPICEGASDQVRTCPDNVEHGWTSGNDQPRTPLI